MKPRNLKHRLDAMESDELRRLQSTKSSAKPWRVSRQRSVGYISQMLREGFRLHTCEADGDGVTHIHIIIIFMPFFEVS